MKKVFLNNKIVDASKAFISAADAGFLYGAGLFETMRCKDNVVFAIDDHLDRLFYSSKSLSINISGDKKYLIDAVYKTIEANGLKNARIRLTATSGAIGTDENSEPTLLITVADFCPYPTDYYKKGAMVVISSNRQNSADPAVGHKTTNFFPRLLALSDAHKKQAAEALWFTTDGVLAEGCVSNVFLVKDSVVYTPRTGTPVLAGVARKYVCSVAMKNSIELIEKDLIINDLLEADEVFLTNVIMQVLPVIKVEAHDVKDARPGPVTKKLSGLFDEALNLYCSNYTL